MRGQAMPGINTHIHLPPNFSAFESVEQAVALASEQGVGILGASNYYDFTVYHEFERLCHERGILPIFGIEIVVRIPELAERGIRINDPGNPGKMYLCGKSLTQWAEPTPAARRILNEIRTRDSKRMAEMVKLIAAIFAGSGVDTGLSAEAVVDLVVPRHRCPRETVTLQERHVAQAFQEALFKLVPVERRAETLGAILGTATRSINAVGVQGEIRSRLMKAGKAAFVEETFIGFDEAMLLIRELGGVPCYPVLADGANPICEYEADIPALITDLQGRGIRHAEFIPSRNAPEVLRRYAIAMRDAGFCVTAGTEHNTLDLLPLTPTCLRGEPIPEEVEKIFREGANELNEPLEDFAGETPAPPVKPAPPGIARGFTGETPAPPVKPAPPGITRGFTGETPAPPAEPTPPGITGGFTGETPAPPAEPTPPGIARGFTGETPAPPVKPTPPVKPAPPVDPAPLSSAAARETRKAL